METQEKRACEWVSETHKNSINDRSRWYMCAALERQIKTSLVFSPSLFLRLSTADLDRIHQILFKIGTKQSLFALPRHIQFYKTSLIRTKLYGTELYKYNTTLKAEDQLNQNVIWLWLASSNEQYNIVELNMAQRAKTSLDLDLHTTKWLTGIWLSLLKSPPSFFSFCKEPPSTMAPKKGTPSNALNELTNQHQVAWYL